MAVGQAVPQRRAKIRIEENMIQHFRYEMGALYDKPCHMYNVGAMMKYMDYTPRTLEEIIRREQNK